MKTIVVYAIAFVALVDGIYGHPNPEEKKQICTPGARTTVDCNQCTCSNDGTALGCTRMACPKIPAEYLNPDGSLKQPHNANPLLRTKRDHICEPGTTKRRDCNTCYCNQDGTAEACTRMECPPPPRQRRDDFRCTPNSNFMDECNSCRCSPDGRSAACTLMACESFSPLLYPTGSISRPNQNNPLPRTKRADQFCKPGEVSVTHGERGECTECVCNSDGTAQRCTGPDCPSLAPRSRRDVPFSCVPYQSFKQDCNTCVCSADGRSAGCTYRYCFHDDAVPSIDAPKLAT